MVAFARSSAGGRHVHQPHGEAALRERLGDAVAHRAGADHANQSEIIVIR